jgi:hypothetical protein
MKRVHHLVPVMAIVLAVGTNAPPARQASDQDTIQRLQQQIEELRAQIRDLQQQVAALAAAPHQTPSPAPPAAGTAPPAPEATPQLAAPAGTPSGTTRAGSSIFNPAISAVFQFIGNNSFNHDPEGEGFELSEAELALQSVVDPYARVDLFFSFGADGEAEVEEGTVTSTGMPGGLQLKGGRFKSALGKWNRWHPHQFYTVDSPDVLNAFFGDESLTSDGLSMSWLVPGTGTVFLESTTEVGNTTNDVSFDAEENDPIVLEHLASVFTLTSNATLGAGLSAVAGRSGPTEALLTALDEAGLAGILEPSESLPERILGADLTFKWKPLSRNTYQSAVLQAEAMRSRRDVEVLEGTVLRRETSDVWGGYAYGEYQFAKRWRGGIRYDRTGFPGVEEATQRAVSAVLRILPTEFQEVRVQFRHTTRNHAAALLFDDEADDDQVFFEWIPAIGAHGAHPY